MNCIRGRRPRIQEILLSLEDYSFTIHPYENLIIFLISPLSAGLYAGMCVSKVGDLVYKSLCYFPFYILIWLESMVNYDWKYWFFGVIALLNVLLEVS